MHERNALFSQWNYLRVRGEYIMFCRPLWWFLELPPRARRIPGANGIYASPPGTTSACAENTQQLRVTDRIKRNYLRVRGEYHGKVFPSEWESELPPRARRIPDPR